MNRISSLDMTGTAMDVPVQLRSTKLSEIVANDPKKKVSSSLGILFNFQQVMRRFAEGKQTDYPKETEDPVLYNSSCFSATFKSSRTRRCT